MLDSIAPELVGMVLAETEQRSLNLSKWACQHDDAFTKAMAAMEERMKGLEEKINRIEALSKKIVKFNSTIDARLEEIEKQVKEGVDEERLSQVENDVYELQLNHHARISNASEVSRAIRELRNDINNNNNAANYNANMLRKINANLNFLND